MKPLLIFLYLFGIITSNAYSQDTIQFINKSAQAVKVHEIGIDEIKYHRFDNLDGPLYVASKQEVQYIKFANGHVDSIKTANSPKPISTNDQFVVYKQGNPISSNEKILISGSRLSYNGKAVGEARLFRIITNEPIPEKKSMLLKEYKNMKSYKKKQYLFGFVGLGAGIALPYMGAILSMDSYDGSPFLAGLAAGAIVGVTGAVLSAICKHKRTKKRIEVAKLYNE